MDELFQVRVLCGVSGHSRAVAGYVWCRALQGNSSAGHGAQASWNGKHLGFGNSSHNLDTLLSLETPVQLVLQTGAASLGNIGEERRILGTRQVLANQERAGRVLGLDEMRHAVCWQVRGCRSLL